DYTVPIGKADVKREGDDVTIITYGMTVHYALAAAEQLAAEGISTHVLDLRTIQPLDKPAILAEEAITGKVIVMHEVNYTGGVGAEVSAIIAEELLYDLDAPIMRLGGPDVPAMPISPPMEKFFMPNKEKVLDAMLKLAQY